MFDFNSAAWGVATLSTLGVGGMLVVQGCENFKKVKAAAAMPFVASLMCMTAGVEMMARGPEMFAVNKSTAVTMCKPK